MDFETLITLVLLAGYFLLQLVGGKRRKRQQQPLPEPLPSSETAPDSSLQEALREIREALGVEPPPPAPVPPTEPLAVPEPASYSSSVPGPPKPDDRLTPETAPSPSPARRPGQKSSLRSKVKDVQSLREAILLKEVLDPPLSLRRPR